MLRVVAALLFAVLPSLAFAQGWPAKPVKVVVPFPAGGLADSIARITAEKLQSTHGQPFIVENKPGAGGTIGATQVAAAPGDGYTLLFVLDTHAINHHLYSNLAYDAFKSFAYVSRLVSSPQMVAAPASFGPKTLAELIDHAKAKLGDVTYGSIGAGSANHLNALLFEARTGVKMTHVPYKGGAPMIQDLLGGQINIAFVAAPTNVQHVKSGKLKVLAVGPAKRMAQFPDVPTLGETLPGFEASSWVGLLAPAATPADVLAQIHKLYTAAVADADVKAKLEGQGFEIVNSSSADFAAFVKAESEKLGKVIKDNNVKVE
jgi:tripartite-type tricarboxylate transporter receptor subunit TctC